MQSALFAPLELRGIRIPNRVFMSPMCQYSAVDGMPHEWHLVHLGSRAVGGAGLVLAEATAVVPEGRISPGDTGIWGDAHMEAWSRIASFVKAQGAVAAIQLGHAGRKASCHEPWHGGAPLAADEGAWQTVAPSPVPFAESDPEPRELTPAEIDALPGVFAAAARRATTAGFQAVELHMAHGYLLHQFLSPISNQRQDAWGGGLENRMRLPLAVASAVREALGESRLLLARVSCTDWVEGGWDLDQTVAFASRLKAIGVDLVDCSAGGMVPKAPMRTGPGFMTPFATQVRRGAGMPTATVGFITQPAQAEQIVATGLADAVLLARELLRDPYWPLHAARELGVDVAWPNQYLRAKR
ncbi:MAG TPA: NADH:flavin oxidoreductase/NADH oxidase [Thermoanaerobaculaceae bacterium]|nr:NADH:flavin oxidoreductase/NADH oxidase [Thermoanaerobaculaceae bacterium]HPS77924.1 NADH:flavin oxidoreductase/NADH oxidase [Thermoanaerobaculaceae bacterium]